MKSLRKLHNKANPGKKIRYYMAGEYGEDNARPHFHACLFGIDFTDKYPWRKNHQGDILYRSPTIEKIWHKGAVELGTVTLQSAGYVARYVLKKITGQHASTHYQRTDPATGELYTLPPEYNRMSLKPGIGANWFHQYKTDVYNGRNYLIHEGAKMAPPRYYHTLLERENKPAADAIKASRQHFERTRAPQNGTAREQIQKAAIRSLQRSLKETI